METADQAYLDCVRDILEHPVFQSMDEYIQHGNTTCKEHCMRVSYLSYRICVRRGPDCFTTCFYMTGIPMGKRRGIGFMALPIPGQPL